jgi:hypothetical protein
MQLQRLIDLGRVDSNQPIDLTQIVNSKVITLKPMNKQYGIHLTDEVIIKIELNFQRINN